MSAAPRPVTSRIIGRLLPPLPELSWRTRRETRLTSTFGLLTFANACLHNSLFKDALHLQVYRAGQDNGLRSIGNKKNNNSFIVKAVILAAGKGTRMRELTDELPKPMLKVQGKPILEHILDGLAAAGIQEVFIVTGFRAEVIEGFFGNGKRCGVQITYGRQTVQDGTGKAPEVAKEFVANDPFLLTYGDILVKPETYQQMLRRWREGKFSGLVTVTASEDVTKGGLNFFDEAFCLTRLVEKPSAAQLDELRRQGLLKSGQSVWYNAGIYIFEPVLFDFTAKLQKSPRDEYELTDALNALVAAGHLIAGMPIAGRWVDVRDPEVLARLESEESRDAQP